MALQQDFTKEPVVCKCGCAKAACKDHCTACSEVLQCMRSRLALYNGGTGGLPEAQVWLCIMSIVTFRDKVACTADYMQEACPYSLISLLIRRVGCASSDCVAPQHNG